MSAPENINVDTIAKWWHGQTEEDMAKTIPKAAEYGAGDLEAIGRMLLSMVGWEDAPERVGIEMGIAFYLYGKCARLMSAYAEKRLPSQDTWDDACIYTMMARYVREHGQWP